MLYLLDTDHLSLLQRGGKEGIAIGERLATLAQDDYGTSIVSYIEQTHGRWSVIQKAVTAQEQVIAFAQLRDTLRFYRNIAVWDYSLRAAASFRQIKKLRPTIKRGDAQNDFERIPGLRLQNWAVTQE